MNMRAAMTDEQLLAQRALRTGKKIPASNGDTGRGPGAPIQMGNPLEGYDTNRNDDDDDGAPAFNPNNFGGNVAPNATPNTTASFDAAALQQQLDAANGRAAPLQRQIEEMRAALTAAQQLAATQAAQLTERQQAEAAAAAAREAATFDPFEGMSADDLSLIDPATLSAMRRVAQQSLARATANTQDPQKLIADALEARDKKARDSFIRATVDGLGLVALGNDPKFQAFLHEDDSAGLLLNSFVQSPDVDVAKSLEGRVRSMLKRYEKSQPANSNNQSADPQARLAASMSRQGAGAGAHGSARKPLTPEQGKAIRQQSNALTRQGKFKEAKELLAQLN